MHFANLPPDLKDNFALFVKKDDGKVNLSELGTILRALGLNPTEGEVKSVQAKMDPSGVVRFNPCRFTELSPRPARAALGDKRISFDEFLPIYNGIKAKKPLGSFEEFVEGLRVFDKDGNGTINSAELRRVLTSLGEKLSDEDMDSLLQGVKVDAHGGVNYEEFVRMVMA